MSDEKEALEKVRAEMAAIPDKKVKRPQMPVSVMVQEAKVNLTKLFTDEAGVGDEQGMWEAYSDGVLVASDTFTAQNADGTLMLNINVAGGFDELRFTSINGTNDADGGDDMVSAGQLLAGVDRSGRGSCHPQSEYTEPRIWPWRRHRAHRDSRREGSPAAHRADQSSNRIARRNRQPRGS